MPSWDGKYKEHCSLRVRGCVEGERDVVYSVGQEWVSVVTLAHSQNQKLPVVAIGWLFNEWKDVKTTAQRDRAPQESLPQNDTPRPDQQKDTGHPTGISSLPHRSNIDVRSLR